MYFSLHALICIVHTHLLVCLCYLSFQLGGGALLWALGQALGKEWTSEVEEAWTLFYGYVTKEMKIGMGNK